ncbi:hypothetical protein [Actinoplanes philippinensis]|uniref:hypothetical protein n=1 Tax=Actinoplanes philippinensis TaxID=35752 RepID=UPI0033E597C9
MEQFLHFPRRSVLDMIDGVGDDIEVDLRCHVAGEPDAARCAGEQEVPGAPVTWIGGTEQSPAPPSVPGH